MKPKLPVLLLALSVLLAAGCAAAAGQINVPPEQKDQWLLRPPWADRKEKPWIDDSGWLNVVGSATAGASNLDARQRTALFDAIDIGEITLSNLSPRQQVAVFNAVKKMAEAMQVCGVVIKGNRFLSFWESKEDGTIYVKFQAALNGIVADPKCLKWSADSSLGGRRSVVMVSWTERRH